MLADPADEVLLLPATTRYEQPGGGTETTTERRIAFSPEIPGRRIGEARSEWQVLVELLRRVDARRAAFVDFRDAASIRADIARAVPFYAGIERLHSKGDSIQYGGERLCESEGAPRFPTEDGRARFAVVPIDGAPIPDGRFLASTRRGRQEDCERLGLREGTRVRLVSDAGSLACRVRIAPIRPRNLQVHWPEGNALIARGRYDPRCGEPDYNALVEVKLL